MTPSICKFSGDYEYLSNFYPCKVSFDGEDYCTVEHAYVAAKTLDQEIRRRIRLILYPGQVKKFGRMLKLRSDWDEIKLRVMHDLVLQKFSVEPLRSRLIATGDAEVYEGNTWGDRYWGIYKGEGLNHLGRIIMDVRSIIAKTPP